MKLRVGNLLDNLDLSYEHSRDDIMIATGGLCSGCKKVLSGKVVNIPFMHKASLMAVVCLECTTKIFAALDKLDINNYLKDEDGEFCIRCKNFSPMAEKNFEIGLLCWSCNTYTNRIILGLE